MQEDATQSFDEIARKVNSSKTPVWGRIRKMREDRVIGAQIFVVNAEALGFEACFFVLIRTSEHEAEWQAAFLEALNGGDEVQEAHRLAGNIDYILDFALKMRMHTIYFISKLYLMSAYKMHNVMALLSMEEIKSTTKLPIKTG